MKPIINSNPFLGNLRIAAFTLALAGLSQTLNAAALTWDLSTTAGTQTGDGIWSTSDANWSSDGTTLVNWSQTNATTATNTATFGGADGTYAITLGTDIAAQTLTFSNSGYTLGAASAQILSLTNVGNSVIQVADGKSATIGGNASVAFTTSSNTGVRTNLSTGGTLNIGSGGTLSRTAGGASTLTGGAIGFMGTGTVNVAGTLSYAGGGSAGGGLVLAQSSGANITMNLDGGTLSSNSSLVGIALTGALTSTTTAVLNVNSGSSVSTTSTATTSSAGISLSGGANTSGTVNLNGGSISTSTVTNTYNGASGGTGTFNFNGGTLRAVVNNTSFMTGLTRANVRDGGAKIDTNGFNITIGQSLLHSNISGDNATDGGLAKSGVGALTLSGTGTYNGGTAVNEGTVRIGNNSALGTGTVNIAGGATVNNSAALSGLANTFTGTGAFTTVAGAGQVTLSGDWSGFSGTVSSATTADLVFNGGFTSGVANTTSANAAYVNNYNVNNTNGMIVQNLTGGPVTYKLGSYASATGSNLRNSGTATGSVIFEIGNLNTDTIVAGGIGGGAQTISLTKVGGGKLTLQGTNTYTGATLVSAGTLLVNGSLANTAVSVTGGTLGGTGTIGGAVTVSGTAIFSPGAFIESLSTGELTMESGTTFVYESVDATSTGADLVAANGALSLSGVALDLAGANLGLGSWMVGDKLTLISYTGTGITSGFSGYDDGMSYFFGSNEWLFDYNDGDYGNNFSAEAAATGTSFVTMTLIPEPGAALLGSLGMLVLMRRKRANFGAGGR